MSFRDESQTSNEGEDGLRDIHPLDMEQAESLAVDLNANSARR